MRLVLRSKHLQLLIVVLLQLNSLKNLLYSTGESHYTKKKVYTSQKNVEDI